MNQNMSAHQTTILLVDDSSADTYLLAKYLQKSGFRTFVATNGESALQQARQIQPDLILLDVMMPGIDGFETCERLKGADELKDIPVIFMTALTDIVNKVRGFEVGGVDYITKPFQYEEIFARITSHLTIRNQQKQLQLQHEHTLQLNTQLEREIQERKRAETALEEANQTLQCLATTDPLTQIANRRRFDEYLCYEWQRAGRTHEPLALILCDIDYFKCYNDTYGHLAGDACLQQVAQGIHRAVRRVTDLVARYGGEEFAIVLPNTSQDGVLCVAHIVQDTIRAMNIPHKQSSVSPHITLSIGGTSLIPSAEGSVKLLIHTVDTALYEAKAQGRNQIVVVPFDKDM